MKRTLPLKIVIPLVLGIIASLAVAVYAELGYRRLEVANKQMAVALEMQAILQEVLLLVVDAETGQRGFLLTGNNIYLEPYEASLQKFDVAFNSLRELLVAHATSDQRNAAGRFNNLVGRRLAELELTITLYRKEGPAADSTGPNHIKYEKIFDFHESYFQGVTKHVEYGKNIEKNPSLLFRPVCPLKWAKTW